MDNAKMNCLDIAILIMISINQSILLRESRYCSLILISRINQSINQVSGLFQGWGRNRKWENATAASSFLVRESRPTQIQEPLTKQTSFMAEVAHQHEFSLISGLPLTKYTILCGAKVLIWIVLPQVRNRCLAWITYDDLCKARPLFVFCKPVLTAA